MFGCVIPFVKASRGRPLQTCVSAAFTDGAFFQPNSKRWCRGDASAAGTGDGEEQHRMDPEQ